MTLQLLYCIFIVLQQQQVILYCIIYLGGKRITGKIVFAIYWVEGYNTRWYETILNFFTKQETHWFYCDYFCGQHFFQTVKNSPKVRFVGHVYIKYVTIFKKTETCRDNRLRWYIEKGKNNEI